MSGTDAGPGGDSAAARNAVLAVGIVALVAFVPALRGGFVYDDHRFVEANPHLGDASILWRAFADPSCQTADDSYAGLWRPLRTLSFALDRAVFGASAFGPHAVSVLLHATGAALLTSLLTAWRLPALAAALGGALYALHPAQVECVAWISSRGDLLAAGFVWGALLADLRGRPRAAIVLGVLALLSKEQAVVWPALVVCSRRLAGEGFTAAARAALWPAVAAAVYIGARQAVFSTVPADALQEGGLGAPGFQTLAAMLAHQAWTTVVPLGAVFDWQLPRVDVLPAAATLVLGGVAAALCVRGLRASVAWFAIALAPTLFAQVAVPLNIRVADRFLMFAIPALALTGARAVAASRGAAVACGAAALCLGALTESRIPQWRDDVALWTGASAAAGGNWRADAWLGESSLRNGQFDEAERFLRRAVAARPQDAKTRYRLAVAQERIAARDRDDARVEAALLSYQGAIELFRAPRAEGAAELLPLARWAAADLLVWTGRLDAGRQAIERLLAEPPPSLGPDARAALAARRSILERRAAVALDTSIAARIRAWGSPQ